MDRSHVSVARRVIAEEADALRALAGMLDGSFDKAVELILAARGRVIASGMPCNCHR